MPRDPNVPAEFDVYTMVLLRAARRTLWRCRTTPSPRSRRATSPHRADLRRQGVLVVNGPLDEQSDVSLRGLSLFACDLDEARRLSDADPSVQAGRLAYDVFEWWVAAGSLSFPDNDRRVGERRSMEDD